MCRDQKSLMTTVLDEQVKVFPNWVGGKIMTHKLP
jgi:hypothetical protein